MHKSNPKLRTPEKKSGKHRSPTSDKKKLKPNVQLATTQSVQLTQPIEVHTPSTVNEEKFEQKLADIELEKDEHLNPNDSNFMKI